MNLTLILIFLFLLLVWLFFTIISLKVAFRSRMMSKTIIPSTTIFLLISFAILGVSVYYLSLATSTSTYSSNISTSSRF